MRLRLPFALVLSFSMAMTAGAGDASPRTVAKTFNQALAAGDEKTVRELLMPDVRVFESGGAENSADEYASHHLPADIAFMAQMKRRQLSQTSGGDDANAWVATRSHWRGRFKGKDIDLDTTETLVMTHTDNGWRIAHIHWSSGPHRAAAP